MTEKQREIIIKSLIWFIGLFIIIFIGVNNVFADTFNPSSALQYYEYYQGNTKQETSIQYGNNIMLGSPNAINYPYAMSLILYGNYLQDKTYTLNVNIDTYFESNYFKFYYENLNYLIVSAQIVTGSERTLCNLQPITQNQSYSVGCTFKPTNNLSQVILSLVNYDYQNNGYVPFGSGDYVKFTNYNMAVYDNSSNIIIDQNNTIINQNNQNTQSIINNNNTNTENIINNQNQNTQEQIESQKVCENIIINKDYPNLVIAYLRADGSLGDAVNDRTTDYIEIKNNTIIQKTVQASSGSNRVCFYNTNKENINCIEATNFNGTIPNNAKYVRFTIFSSDNTPQYSISSCTNGNQALDDSIKEQTKTSKGILGKIKDLFDTLFSNDDADISGLDNMVGWLPAGPVDSIINLPLALFNSLTNTLSGTCTPVTLSLPFVNQQLTLPCFDSYMSEHLTGFSTLWTWVGITVSVFILYNYLLSLYKWIDDTLTMRENNLPGYYDDNMWGGA